MSIKIDSEKCISCGKCAKVCPGSLLYKDKAGKMYNRFPKDCWGCTACVKECDFGAISYFLGTDVGGRGTTLYTKKEGELLHWIFVKPDGEEKKLTVNSKEANKY